MWSWREWSMRSATTSKSAASGSSANAGTSGRLHCGAVRVSLRMKARWLTSSTDGPVCSGVVDSTTRPCNSMASRSSSMRRRLICKARPPRCTCWRASSVPRATRPRRGGCSSSPSASRSDSATCAARPPRCTSWRASSVPRATRPRRGGCSSSPSASRSGSATCKARPPRCTSWRASRVTRATRPRRGGCSSSPSASRSDSATCAARPPRCTSWRSSRVTRATRPRRGGCSSRVPRHLGATQRPARPGRLAARAGEHRECPGQPGRGAAAAPAVPRHQGATRRPARPGRLAAPTGDHRECPGQPGRGAAAAPAESLGIWERLSDLQGQAASLHELASIESAQGNPAEARRLLQHSLGIDERLGDLRGQAASLHQLAIIESAQGNPAEARRLWERSIALKDRIGDVEGRASTLIMLAQLEVREGNRQAALGMARESVRLLEGIGNAKVTMARKILAQIETFDADGSAEAPPFLAELGELLERAKDAGPEGGLAAIDAALEEARREAVPSREVVTLLARSVACWNARDVPGCEESLRRAEEALGRVSETERAALAELVERFKAQKATAAGPKESDRLYAEAMAKAQAGDTAGALGLFEASMAASRQEGDTRGVAVNLLMIGQALLVPGRTEEARERLQEGLEVAQEVGDGELLKAMQEVATVAAAMAKGMKAEGAARGDDDVSER